MSDFLTNLVMRSYSGTPSVQPMTHSAYAAPEAAPEPEAESFEPFVEEITPAPGQPRRQVVAPKPVQETPAEPVQHTDEIKSVSIAPEAADVIVPRAQTPEPEQPLIIKEKSVSPAVAETKPPRVNRRPVSETTPTKQSRVPGPTPVAAAKPSSSRAAAAPAEPATPRETIVHRTEIQPAQPIYRTPIQTVQPATRRLIKKSTNASESPAQTTPSTPSSASSSIKPETRTRKAEPEIVEQVIEQVIERQSVAVENTQHVTNSFTTLIPNTTAQRLPALNLKPRPNTPLPVLPDEAEPPAPPTETVINVAIGRIEVRATPAATPSRERQPAGPKVRTLDDYLQQRSRGTQ